MDSYQEAAALAVAKRLSVADDEDIGLMIKYIGSEASCTITVTGDGDIQSAIGAVGSEATDTTFLEPGGTGGTIDVSDTLANTFAKVVNLINSFTNYEAYLVDVLAATASTGSATSGGLVAMAAAQAKSDAGLALYKDTTDGDGANFEIAVAVSGETFDYKEDVTTRTQ